MSGLRPLSDPASRVLEARLAAAGAAIGRGCAIGGRPLPSRVRDLPCGRVLLDVEVARLRRWARDSGLPWSLPAAALATVERARRVATEAGEDEPGVWRLLEAAARIETSARALEAALAELQAPAPVGVSA